MQGLMHTPICNGAPRSADKMVGAEFGAHPVFCWQVSHCTALCIPSHT